MNFPNTGNPTSPGSTGRYRLMREVEGVALDSAQTTTDAVALLKRELPASAIPSGEYVLVDTSFVPGGPPGVISFAVVGTLSYQAAEVKIITR